MSWYLYVLWDMSMYVSWVCLMSMTHDRETEMPHGTGTQIPTFSVHWNVFALASQFIFCTIFCSVCPYFSKLSEHRKISSLETMSCRDEGGAAASSSLLLLLLPSLKGMWMPVRLCWGRLVYRTRVKTLRTVTAVPKSNQAGSRGLTAGMSLVCDSPKEDEQEKPWTRMNNNHDSIVCQRKKKREILNSMGIYFSWCLEVIHDGITQYMFKQKWVRAIWKKRKITLLSLIVIDGVNSGSYFEMATKDFVLLIWSRHINYPHSPSPIQMWWKGTSKSSGSKILCNTLIWEIY